MRCAVFLAAVLLVEAAAGQEPLLSIPSIPEATELAGKKDPIWIWMDSGKKLSPGCSKALIEHEGHLIISPGYELAPARVAPKSQQESWNWSTEEDLSPLAVRYVAAHRGPVTLFLNKFTSKCVDSLVDRTGDMTINIKMRGSDIDIYRYVRHVAAQKNCPRLCINLSHDFACRSLGTHVKELRQAHRVQRHPSITITHHRELRRWADKNDRVYYDAQYQSIDANRNVRLRLLDGTFREVPLAELRGSDRGFVLCADGQDKLLAEMTAKEQAREREEAAKPADPFRPVAEDQKAGKQ